MHGVFLLLLHLSAQPSVTAQSKMAQMHEQVAYNCTRQCLSASGPQVQRKSVTAEIANNAMCSLEMVNVTNEKWTCV